MKRFPAMMFLVLLPSLAHAATITLTITTSTGQTATSAPLSTDDTSAASIIAAYQATLNGGKPPNPVCAPNCTTADALTSMAQQFAAAAAQFTQQYLQTQAMKQLPEVPVVTAPR